MGHKFKKSGPDSTITEAIKNWIAPSNVTELRRFVGLASYYRRYIKHFSTIAEPLLHLTNKGSMVYWSPGCQKAFNEFKERLQSPPILICPDFSIEFTLYTDASDSGLGAVFQQNNQVVAYASRTLNRAEKRYSVIEKECLALVYTVKQFRHYLLGKPFTIFKDFTRLYDRLCIGCTGRLRPGSGC